MKKLSIILVILWIAVICSFSSSDGVLSTTQSEGLVSLFARIIHYTGDLDTLRYIVRKCAHVLEYFVLGLLAFNACRYNNVKQEFIVAILISILVASIDEIHQLFVCGRSGNLYDALIDTMGSLVGIFGYKILRK